MCLRTELRSVSRLTMREYYRIKISIQSNRTRMYAQPFKITHSKLKIVVYVEHFKKGRLHYSILDFISILFE